jgi:hypothetical protein
MPNNYELLLRICFYLLLGYGWLAYACRCVRSLSAGCAQPGAIFLSVILYLDILTYVAKLAL